MSLCPRVLQLPRKALAFGLSVFVVAAMTALSLSAPELVQPAFASPGATPGAGTAPGYWLVGADGGVFDFGSAQFHGSAGSLRLRESIVGMAATPDGGGYWLVAADGGVFTYGDAVFHGSAGGMRLSAPIVGMAATPDGGGYWLVAADGGVFTYGDAVFYGSMGALHLNAPIVGMAAMPDGNGYWLVAADGGVFTYGNAVFYGSTGALHLNAPIVGMAATPDESGYWLVAADGGVFTYGDAGFYGSAGNLRLHEPIVGIAANPGGYRLVASDGGIFNYGDAGFMGSAGGTPLNAPVVGIAQPAATGGSSGGPGSPGGPTGAANAPAAAPVTWCETGLPQSPYTAAPGGAVIIPAGDDSSTAPAEDFSVQPNTTYWFAPGTHTIGGDEFAQFHAAPGDTFVGAPGAVIDGQGVNDYAFEAAGTESGPAHVTIEYLTIQHFTAPAGEGVVGQGDHDGWTVDDNLIQNNPDGAGVVIDDNDLVQNNCLQFNGEYGFNGQGNNAVLTHNDINDNNNQHAFDFPGSAANNQCGCSGGGKWWEGLNDQTIENYVHGNQDVGIWYDTNNAGALISGNYVADNYSVGIQYEASYNAQITNNTLVGNAVGEGSDQQTPGFPDGAIYVSESGGDSRVASNYSGQLLISGNVLNNNWGGVILWENSDRYCSDGSDNACTLINPAIYTERSCAANLSEKSPVDYYDNCRWKTQNVTVKNNTMSFNAATVASACTVANLCGFNGLFSNYGTSQYGQAGPIAFEQDNHFSNNTYSGPWHFWAWSQSNLANPVSWAEWTAPVTDRCGTAGEISSGTCSSGFGQDAGSTLS